MLFRNIDLFQLCTYLSDFFKKIESDYMVCCLIDFIEADID